jgi:hypothetical protein
MLGDGFCIRVGAEKVSLRNLRKVQEINAHEMETY